MMSGRRCFSQASLHADLSLFSLPKSSIHGRGVFASREVRQGDSVGMVWFDFLHTDEECLMPPYQLRGAREGYISNGGTLPYAADLTLADAITQCQADSYCKGITFPHAGNFSCLGSAAMGECSDAALISGVELKSHAAFVEFANWTSLLKPDRQISYWPPGCNQQYPVGDDRANMPGEQALGCWSRWVNHKCDANLHVAFTSLPGFTIPGLPWARCVRSVTAVASEDIAAGSELTLNYEVLPSYVVNSVPGVKACSEQ